MIRWLPDFLLSSPQNRPSRLASLLLTAGLIGTWLTASAILVSLWGCSHLTSGLSRNVTAEEDRENEVKYRERYLRTGSSEALRWLVVSRLTNGMTKAEVDAVLGEVGEREFNDSRFLSEGGLYRTDDLVYRWGPDRDGNVYLFVFRDNHLVNIESFKEQLKAAGGPRVSLSISSDDF